MSHIIELLQNSFEKYPDKVALRYKSSGRWLEHTYQSIWDLSDRVASGLNAWGLQPSDRVALLGASSPNWVITYFGILKSNAVTVPIDKELKHSELRHILADCQARIIFSEKPYSDTIHDIADHLPTLEKMVLMEHVGSTVDSVHSQVEKGLSNLYKEWQRINQKYSFSMEDKENFEKAAENLHNLLLPGETTEEPKKGFFQRLIQPNGEKTNSQLNTEDLSSFLKSAGPLDLNVQPHTPAIILYTSGTTGRSKGAMLSHTNIISNVQTASDLFKLTHEMHTLSFLPINHVFEQVAGIILPLSVGGTVSFAESIKKLGDNLAEVKPNFLLGVPAVFRLLADRMTRKIETQTLAKLLFRLPPTRPFITKKIKQAFGGNPVFISGGAALDPHIASKLMDFGLDVFQGYGITETSPVIAVETPEHKRLGTVGRPIPEVEVKIHHANAEGVGEIWVKGPNVMLGYYNNQEATNEVISDGWYHTGDLGCIEEGGFVKICGRVKNLIVTANGKNVYPEEVENELLNSSYIAEIMVYGHKVNASSEEVYALIYPDQNALDTYAEENNLGPLSIEDIEEIIKKEVLEYGRNLADYKRVKKFTLREDEFPKTTTRKIKRFVVEADIDTAQSEQAE